MAETQHTDLSPVKTLDDWADAISRAWYRTLESCLEVGRLILEAEATLGSQEIRELRQRRLPFGASVYSKLKTIAKDARLNDKSNHRYLPPAYSTLYEISQLDDGQFGAGIETGFLNPELTRQEAIKYRKGGATSAQKLSAADNDKASAAPEEQKIATIFGRKHISFQCSKKITALLKDIEKVKGVTRIKFA